MNPLKKHEASKHSKIENIGERSLQGNSLDKLHRKKTPKRCVYPKEKKKDIVQSIKFDTNDASSE